MKARNYFKVLVAVFAMLALAMGQAATTKQPTWMGAAMWMQTTSRYC